MNTKALEKFAQGARRQLHNQITAKLERILTTDSGELRAKAKTVQELQQQVQKHGKEGVVEQVAYTWFNRFCALRYMDVNRYTRIGIVSPAPSPEGETFTQPEILQEAKQGLIDSSVEAMVDAPQILDLLSGRIPSPDAQGEAYRLLLVGACNVYHESMPFLFEKIDDYTELLMPDDLLSQNSILHAMRGALTPETCQDVEVIGWLYQFYISEKKDQVIGSKKKITPENIPAATQLFTPHWIVRYLVENSLGRLWLLNRPNSRLAERMDYYIRPEEEETDFLRVNSPEELRVCDPAAGSGHMLTYAFDLLYTIYEEEGYAPSEIPGLILTKNLYGMEIDERAGALAAFALTMKACEKDRRFLRRGVHPNICVLRPITFTEQELKPEVERMVQAILTDCHSERSEESTRSGNEDSSSQTPRNDRGVACHSERSEESGTREESTRSGNEDSSSQTPRNDKGVACHSEWSEESGTREESTRSGSGDSSSQTPRNDKGVACHSERSEESGTREESTRSGNEDSSSQTPRNDKGVACHSERSEESLRSGSGDSSPAARNDMNEEKLRADLLHDLTLFAEADNFGALLRPLLRPGQIDAARTALSADDATGQIDWLMQEHRAQLLRALEQVATLARKYHVVVANPPYMGSKNINARLKSFLGDNYKDYKSDLFAAFSVRIMEMTQGGGFIGMMTPFNWMFLSSFEKLRCKILNENTITNLVRPEFHAFFDSAYVTICGFTLFTRPLPDFKGAFIDLDDFYGADIQPVKALEALQNPDCGWFYRAAAADFKKIPGSPIAYWVSDKIRNAFVENKPISAFFFSDGLTKTGNNDKYLRYHWEVERLDAEDDNQYRICVKGGDARSFYGNINILVKWSIQERQHYRSDNVARITPEYLWYGSGISWTKISSKGPTFRWFGNGMIAETGGPAIFHREEIPETVLWQGLGFLASKVSWDMLTATNPTLNFQTNDVLSLPFRACGTEESASTTQSALDYSKKDWDAYETSWDYANLPLLRTEFRRTTLTDTYTALRSHWREMTLEMQRLEEENNRLFINAYGLQEELTPDVPLSEITLTCNPHYRYSGNRSEAELEKLLRADTLREFISYAVGCMFGRYSLDKPGLILANAGETVEDYVRKVASTQIPHSVRNDNGGTGRNDNGGTGRNDRGVVCHSEEAADEKSTRTGAQIPHSVRNDRGAICHSEEAADEESTRAGTQIPHSVRNDRGAICHSEEAADEESTHAGAQIPHSVRNDSGGAGRNDSGGDGITFPPDKDNVIPLLDGDWFTDDISERFKRFLRITFGEEAYAENLRFIEEALGRDIRSYFLREFYDDHIKRYQKRPIYWLFSSPKGSFNALIYMHRYRPDTVSVVLNDYLREFRTKLTTRKQHLEGVNISAGTSQRDKTRALKEIGDLDKILDELNAYENEVLYPLATQQVEIDLDDGVKVNYNKLGDALKTVRGLSN